MAYIALIDYQNQINDHTLYAVIRSDTTLLGIQENATMQEIEGYLAQRYVMALEWAKTGTDRNPLIVMYMIDMCIYHLMSAIPNRQMPQMRIDRYLAAKDYFERAAAGKVTLNLDRVLYPDTDTAQQMIVGSTSTKWQSEY